MSPSGSPTVRRRRLAAELRRLRGNRKGGEVARAIGWSASKISRAESGRESLPPTEIEKLIDYYGVTEPLRGQLLGLAEDAVQRGWWDDYADILTPQYLEFIGLEDEAVSCLHWQSDVIPGILQTEDYARQLNIAYRGVVPTIPPSVHDRFLRVRMRRQERLSHEPALKLSVVIDEAVLLRGIGSNALMRAQLKHLADATEMPNIDLRILPLKERPGLVSSSFVIMQFGIQEAPEGGLGDVVSTESLVASEIYVEGETDTRLYSIFFDALRRSALSSTESRRTIIAASAREWP
jgi:transcriptional regulator with XRE-family HTH domain